MDGGGQSGPKSRYTVPESNKFIKMDKSMSKILTKLQSNKKGLNFYPINPQIFEFLPYVHLFKDFLFKTFKDFICFQIALTRSIVELGKCSFFSNRSEFRQTLIGYVISELRRQKGV